MNFKFRIKFKSDEVKKNENFGQFRVKEDNLALLTLNDLVLYIHIPNFIRVMSWNSL